MSVVEDNELNSLSDMRWLKDAQSRNEQDQKETRAKMENGHKEILKAISEISVVLAKQDVTLENHTSKIDTLQKEIEPIKKHVAVVQGGMKFFGVTLTILGIIATAFSCH